MIDSALTVRGAHKSLADQQVLCGLNMTVPANSVYSLVGASGCGKTTLLKCIVGELVLDQGHIHLSITARSHVGYMPQETALYEDLTVGEIFKFFGRLLGLSDTADRLVSLSCLLQLPPLQALVSTLSGGQKRRVSLGVALLGGPRLIILDEPTVGLDTLLRHSIWEHLHKITREDGKTVVITTHYMEEASASQTVGLLRGGKLLAEDAPDQLLRRFQASSLDQVFLELSHRQESTPSQPSDLEPHVPPSLPLQETRCVHLTDKPFLCLHRISAFVLKSLYSIKNNLMMFYFTVVVPALMLVFWTMVTNPPVDLRVGYHNAESPCSTAFNSSCETPLSCRLLAMLRAKGYHMVEMEADQLDEAVRENRVWASLKFYSNFTRGVQNRLDYFYSLKKVKISPWDDLQVTQDMSNYIIGKLMKKDFYDVFLKSLELWYEDCGWNSKAVHPIIRFEKPVFGRDGPESMQDTGAAAMIVILQVTVAITIAMSFMMTERELGTRSRCNIAGLRYWELVVSQVLSALMSLVPQLVIMQACLLWWFPHLPSGFFMPAFILFLEGLTGILIGVLEATITSQLNATMQFNSMFNSSVSYIVGMLWPVEGQHWLARLVYWGLPSLVPINTYVIMVTRAPAWSNRKVITGLLDSLLWLLLLPVIIALVSRLKNR